jgi:N-acetylneuraminic acid mutarotase
MPRYQLSNFVFQGLLELLSGSAHVSRVRLTQSEWFLFRAVTLSVAVAAMLGVIALVGCGSTDKSHTSSPPPQAGYTVSGTVSGLSGSGMYLQDNGSGYLGVTANGTFTFNTTVASGDAYAVTVLVQPYDPPQTCSVTNENGKANGDVTDVQVSCSTVSVSLGEWAWMGGSQKLNQPGVYGSKGVPSPTNMPGGRAWPCTFKGSSGNLWLFGGIGIDSAGTLGPLNDLWKYDVSTHEWTWISGSNLANQKGIYGMKRVPAVGNVPGARLESVCWTGPSGNFWIFGGAEPIPNNGGELNDLWEYNPTTSMWTWVSGSDVVAQPVAGAYQGTGVYGTKGVPSPNNLPSARIDASGWTGPEGNLWLFGGDDLNGLDNDLWQFNPTTGMWTWVSGSDTHLQFGVYGTEGVASPANVPGARASAFAWTDKDGDLWLFGGEGQDSNGVECAKTSTCELNDLWKYDPATNEWTWMSGSEYADSEGNYGTEGVASSTNVPGARDSGVAWTDAQGNLWLFGGTSIDPLNGYGNINDLWKYDRATDEWTWESGSPSESETEVFGTEGVAASGNLPGPRSFSGAWIDNYGNLWLFGGQGLQTLGENGKMNDLWEYQP